ncbi:MAG: DUF3854 domain-containing protein, partial [Waterburya sp.]
ANVNRAIALTGKLFAKAGVDVKVINWSESAKGVDDLIVQHGAEAFHQAYSKALSLKTWLVQSSVQLTYQANIRVDRRYLGSLVKADKETRRQGDKEKQASPNSPIPHTRHPNHPRQCPTHRLKILQRHW